MSHSLYDSEQPCRALWVQVVSQAKEDLEDEPVGSIIYDQAIAFFTGRGHWAEGRGVIADLLGMHPDDLVRSGQRWIAARRKRDGLPPEPPRAAPAVSTPRVALVRPGLSSKAQIRGGRDWMTDPDRPAVATDAAHVPLNQYDVEHARLKHRRRHWSDIPGAINPFAPRRVMPR